MGGQYLFLSSNGYDHLKGYAETLYGERGQFKHNLQRYFASEEFQQAHRIVNNVEGIPEISFEQIQGIIAREKHFYKLSSHVAKVYTELEQNDKLTDEDVLAYAGILGLVPGQCEWYDTLFPHVIDFWVSSEEEGNLIWNSVVEKKNVVAMMVQLMTDGIRNRQIIQHGNRMLLSQGYARHYFRGENAYYGESRPSAFRNLPVDVNKRRTYITLSTLRMIEFSFWLNQLSFVKKWPFGNVFHGAIAQHYGIPTNGMDVTSDFKTALFFACCQWDSENNEWRPLRLDEYDHAQARPAVERLGGDSRYGLLFSCPVDVANMSRIENDPSVHVTYGVPIGYQPFMRCASQSGYLIEAGETYNMYKDYSFSKVKFRHDPSICEWIFEEMQHGKLIYPQESLGVCDDVVKCIRASKEFTNRAFHDAISFLRYDDYIDEIRENLTNEGYSFTETIQWCSEERMNEFENNWEKLVSNNPQITDPTAFRFGFCI